MSIYLLILMAIAMSASVVEDIRRMKIPNLVTLPTMGLAIVFHSGSGGIDGFLFSFGGLITGIGLFLLPYLMGGLGAGDTKLMGAAGAILGVKGIIGASVIVLLTGGIYGLILYALNPICAVSFAKRLWSTIKTIFLTRQIIIIPPCKEEKQPVLRYAIPIAVGTLTYLALEMSGYDIFTLLFKGAFDI